MDEKAQKFRQLLKQESFAQYFNTRCEIQTLFELLTEEEIDRLIQLNVVFIRSCSPSSHVSISNLIVNDQLTLINFDNDYYNKFSGQEFVAVLLHEIGHVFNPDKIGVDGEYAADKFANDKGYGYWIIQGLQKGLRNNWMGFEKGACELRIDKLNELGPTNVERDSEENSEEDEIIE